MATSRYDGVTEANHAIAPRSRRRRFRRPRSGPRAPFWFTERLTDAGALWPRWSARCCRGERPGSVPVASRTAPYRLTGIATSATNVGHRRVEPDRCRPAFREELR